MTFYLFESVLITEIATKTFGATQGKKFGVLLLLLLFLVLG